MAIFHIEGEEVIEKIVRPRIRGSSAQIYIHKKYANRMVKIVILSKGKSSTVRKKGKRGAAGRKGDKDA